MYAITQLMLNGSKMSNQGEGAPSFDCAEATSSSEILICDNKELSFEDAVLGDLYLMMLQKRTDASKTNFIKKEKAWAHSRDVKCGVDMSFLNSYAIAHERTLCLSEETMTRMNDLLNENGTPIHWIGTHFDDVKSH